MSHYKHLSIEERENLYLLKNLGVGIRKIAEKMGRAPSTISRELKRGVRQKATYRPSEAQARYIMRRKRCGRKHLMSQAKYQEKIRILIEKYQWSPEQISNRLKLENSDIQISYSSIYRAIYSGMFDPKKSHSYVKKQDRYLRFLRKKGKKYKKSADRRRVRFPDAPHISQRPQQANDRSCIGHWEADTVAGIKGGSCILTLTDRCSRFLLAAKVDRNTAHEVSEKMIQLLEQIKPQYVLSITPDRGSEFANFEQIAVRLHKVQFYFPDPYAPWQRGTNENTNGLLREYLPKHCDISPVPDDLIAAFVHRLNLRPRKCLGWRSPFEVFYHDVLHLT